MSDYKIDCPHDFEYFNFWNSTVPVYVPAIGATKLRTGSGHTKRCPRCGYCVKVAHYPTGQPGEFSTVETECPKEMQRPDDIGSSSNTEQPSLKKTSEGLLSEPDPSSPGPSG